jgi:hypothetical protein
MILPSSTNPDRNPDGSKDRLHISPSTGYYRSSENFKKNHHIQFKKIITYKIKWLNEHTTKCWPQLSTNCCTPFWQSWLRTCVSTNNFIGLGSRPRDVACKEKKGCKLNIFISNNKLINDIFHFLVSIVGTRLWVLCEPLRRHVLNILRPYIPRDEWRFEFPPNRHLIPSF